MCNTTCNNHTHEEYNIDYISKEEALNVMSEDVPCQHEQNIYVIDGEYNENEQCSCECSACNEPKKVSCRSLACQQLNDECSCKRNKKKRRKTTMVNVLENNLLRLEDKMNEDLEENINKVYNELKDEEARAKLQEAFLHYGLDDAVTYVEYHADDRLMHFYHENPANCLNVDVHEGCDCDCCNACGCDCNCNYDECQSDIPYTMDENCNIVPMKRERVELFTLDCRDFIRDVFIESARIDYDYPGAVDGNLGEGPWLVITLKRAFETDLADDDQNAHPLDEIRIDLSKIWKLENYYDKPETRAEIKKLRIENTLEALRENNTTDVAHLYYRDIDGDVKLGTVKVKLGDLTSDIQSQINNLGDEITNIFESMPGETTVENKNVTLRWGKKDTIATVNDTNITVTMPAEPTPAEPSSNVTIQDATLQWGRAVKYGTIDGQDVKITLPQKPAEGQGGVQVAVTDVTYDQTTNQLTIIYSEGDPKVIQLSGGDCLWKKTSDGLIPVEESRKVYGYGFYDTAVNN